jgi:Uma2 family endonuclease
VNPSAFSVGKPVRGDYTLIMSLPQPIRRYTPQEYYKLERTAEYKSDYYRGEIFAMAGGTPRHSLICSNIIRETGNRLKNTPCVVYESNLRLKNKITGLRNYPDAAVYCGPLEYDEEDTNRNTVTNPAVVFEVLSPSTEAYDRGFKALNYRRIESLKAYVLAAQDAAHVEIYLRQADNSWLLREEDGLESSLAIQPLGIDLPLAEIYAGVDFTIPAAPQVNQ